MDDAQWKPVAGNVAGLPYMVSNDGSVKGPGGIMTPARRPTGYLSVCLSAGRSGMVIGKMVHRLVAEAFLPAICGKPEINHRDGDKANNRIDNLEWCTRSENLSHACRMGLRVPPSQEKKRKLNRVQVAELRRRYRLGGISERAIAKEFGVSKTVARRIIVEETYKKADGEQ